MNPKKIFERDAIFLDFDCKRMLRRGSKQEIIFEVIQKLSSSKIPEKISNVKNEKFSLYKSILLIFGCLKE